MKTKHYCYFVTFYFLADCKSFARAYRFSTLPIAKSFILKQFVIRYDYYYSPFFKIEIERIDNDCNISIVNSWRSDTQIVHKDFIDYLNRKR